MEKTFAIYVRTSTVDQKSGLEAQARTLTEHCRKQGITNYEIFTDDGISGAKASRPSLDRLMKLVEEDKISHVLVYSFSRFARSTTHLLKALEFFQEKNVDFQSYTEQIQTNSPMGRAFFTVIAAIAQLERELIVERVKNGLKNARAKGKHIGRKKTRPSEAIRMMLKSGLSYRKIAMITKTSHGSIYAEKKAMLKEEREQKEKAEKLKEEKPTLSLVTPKPPEDK